MMQTNIVTILCTSD